IDTSSGFEDRRVRSWGNTGNRGHWGEVPEVWGRRRAEGVDCGLPLTCGAAPMPQRIRFGIHTPGKFTTVNCSGGLETGIEPAGARAPVVGSRVKIRMLLAVV